VVKRRRDLDAAEWGLKENFDQVDRLEAELNHAFEEAIRKLTERKEECRANIGQLRMELGNKVEEAKHEANMHMMEENYKSSSQLANAILRFREEDEPSTLVMVKGNVIYQPEQLTSVLAVSYSLSEPQSVPIEAGDSPIRPGSEPSHENFSTFPPPPPIISDHPNSEPIPPPVISGPTSPLLPLLTARYCAVLDCSSGAWKPKVNLSRLLSIDDKSAFVLLSDNSVIVAGGGLGKNRWSAEVYRISELGEITQLKSLNDARRCPGICLHAGEIFLFGGNNSREMAQSEKLVLSELQNWTRISNMLTARSTFNPCIHLEFIYLCGGAETTLCETFHLATSTFQSLNLALPEPGPTSTVIVGTEMVVLAWHYVLWWDGVQSQRTTRHTDWLVWSNSPPQVQEKSVYLARSWNDCASRIDLDGLHYTKLTLANP
jgi:hypothetical protein